MTPHRFVMPKVTEIRSSRPEPQAQPPSSTTQRDLVAASLLVRRDGGRGARQPLAD
jgi:hypothetical protein